MTPIPYSMPKNLEIIIVAMDIINDDTRFNCLFVISTTFSWMTAATPYCPCPTAVRTVAIPIL